jgi:acetyltransferase-like isoleucine patch superfamily enzyme
MIGQYDFLGSLRMFRNLILTKLFFPRARIIRFPFDIRNKKWITIGYAFTSGVGCRLETHPNNKAVQKKLLIIGDNVEINDYVHINASERVVIGNNVLIASKVYISDTNHGNYSGSIQDSPLTIPKERLLSTKPIIIDDNVWIGESVSIMSGVTIGKGSIIGANSVVTKDVPKYSIVIGIPSVIIKQYNFKTNKWEKV